MKLCKQDILSNKQEWLDKGYMLPEFDIDKVTRETCEAPEWIHFGAGNIFRAFIASFVQRLLNRGEMQKGLVVAEGYDYEIIDRAYRPFDNLCLSVTLKAEGSIEKMVVASVVESLKVDPSDADYARIREIFAAPSLKMASFTITEKGYNIKNADGVLFPNIVKDFEAGPDGVESYIGKVAALLYAAAQTGASSLQRQTGVPAARVNILIGMVVVAILIRGWLAQRISGSAWAKRSIARSARSEPKASACWR